MYSLTTAENIYRAVLDGIKKESTAVLTPEAFNRLINGYALTEWLVDKAGDADKDQPVIDALRNLYHFTEPLAVNRSYEVDLPDNYYRLQAVLFHLGGKDTPGLPAKRMKPDSLSVMAVNPHRTPNDKRIYYFQMGNKIINKPRNKNVSHATLFYLSRPNPIIYNIREEFQQHGNLLIEQNKEVVDICVRIFLERVKEERYQSILTEEAIKNQKSI